MFDEEWREKRFREDVSSHVRSRYPGRLERTFQDVVTYEMIADINVLGTR